MASILLGPRLRQKVGSRNLQPQITGHPLLLRSIGQHPTRHHTQLLTRPHTPGHLTRL